MHQVCSLLPIVEIVNIPTKITPGRAGCGYDFGEKCPNYRSFAEIEFWSLLDYLVFPCLEFTLANCVPKTG